MRANQNIPLPVLLDKPFEMMGIKYEWHIDQLYFGDSPQSVERLYNAHQALAADSLKNIDILTDAKNGNLLLLANNKNHLNLNHAQQVEGIWGSLGSVAEAKLGLMVDGKCYADKVICIATNHDQASINKIFSREAEHHLASLGKYSLPIDDIIKKPIREIKNPISFVQPPIINEKIMNRVWKGVDVFCLGLNLNDEYEKDPNGPWVQKGLIDFIADTGVYAGAIKVMGKGGGIMLPLVVLDVAHPAFEDIYNKTEKKYLELEAKKNRSSIDDACMEAYMQQLIEMRPGLALSMVANTIMLPFNKAIGYLQDYCKYVLVDERRKIDDCIDKKRAQLDPNDFSGHQELDKLHGAFHSPLGEKMSMLLSAVNFCIVNTNSEFENVKASFFSELNKTLDAIDRASGMISESFKDIAKKYASYIGQESELGAEHLNLDDLLKNITNADPLNLVEVGGIFKAMLGQKNSKDPEVVPIEIPITPPQQQDNKKPTKYNLPDFSFERPAPQYFQDQTPVAAKNSEPLVKPANKQSEQDKRVVDNVDRLRVNAPVEGVAPVNQERSNKPNPFQVKDVRLGELTHGGLGVHGDFAGGGSFEAGVKVGGGAGGAALTMFASVDLELTPELYAVLGYAALIALPVISGLAIWSNYQKHKMERTIRHLQRHVDETNQDVKKINDYLTAEVAKLNQLRDTDPKLFDKELKKFNRQMELWLNELQHRVDYAYKHHSYESQSWIGDVRHIFAADFNNLSSSFRRLQERDHAKLQAQNKYAQLPDSILLDKYKQLTGGVLTQANAFEAGILRDLLIERMFNTADLKNLKNNPDLLNRFSPQLGVYLDKVKFDANDKLGSTPRLIDAKHGTRTQLGNKADRKVKDVLNKYDELRQLIADGADRGVVTDKLAELDKLISKSELELKKIELKGRLENAAIFFKSIFNQIADNVKPLRDLGDKVKSNTGSSAQDFHSSYDLAVISDFVTAAKEAKEGVLQGVVGLAANNKLNEAIEFINKINEQPFKLGEVSIPVLEKEEHSRLVSLLSSCRDHANDPPIYWLGQLEKLNNQNNEMSSHEINIVRWQGLVNTLNSVGDMRNSGRHLASSIALEKLHNELQAHYGELFDGADDPAFVGPKMQRVRPDYLFESKIDKFSYHGQMLDPMLRSIQGTVDRYVGTWRPSAAKKILQSSMSGLGIIQVAVPNFLAMSAQGVHAALVGNGAVFHHQRQVLQNQLIKSLANPRTDFNGALIYSQLGVKLIAAVPIEKWVPNSYRAEVKNAREMITWGGSLGIKSAIGLRAAYSLATLQSVNRGMNVATIISTTLEFGSQYLHAKWRSQGCDIETIDHYRKEQSLFSTIHLAGTAATVIETSSVTGVLAAASPIGWIGVAAIGVVAGCELYNNFSDSAYKYAAEKALSGAIGNIKYQFDQIKEAKKLTDSAECADKIKLACQAIRKSCGSMRGVLEDAYGGMRYHPDHMEAANTARVYYLYTLVSAFFEEGDYESVITLTMSCEDSDARKGEFINREIQIPSHLAWQSIYYRLIAYTQERYINNFRNEYQTYAGYIFKRSPSAWDAENRDDVVKQLTAVVKIGLELQISAASISEHKAVSRQLLDFASQNYAYVADWHKLLSDKKKFKVATLAYHMGENELCARYLCAVDFTALRSEADDNFIIDSYDFAMMNGMKNYGHLNLNTSILSDRVSDEDKVRCIQFLLEQGKFDQAILILRENPSYPRKNYLHAKAIWLKSNEADIAGAMDVLLCESNQDGEYWCLLYALAQHSIRSVNFVSNPVRFNDSLIKLYVLLRVAAENLQRQKIEATLFQQAKDSLDAVDKNLLTMAETLLSRGKAKPTEEEKKKWVDSMVSVCNRMLQDVGKMSNYIRSEMAYLYTLMSYEITLANVSIRYIPVLCGDENAVTSADKKINHRIYILKSEKSDILILKSEVIHDKDKPVIDLISLPLEGKERLAHLIRVSNVSEIRSQEFKTSDFSGVERDFASKMRDKANSPNVESSSSSQQSAENKSNAQKCYEIAMTFLNAIPPKFDSAHEHLRLAIEMDDKCKDAHYEMGCLYSLYDKFEKDIALDYFKFAARLGHELAPLFVTLMNDTKFRDSQAWVKWGEEYQLGINSKLKNYGFARVCYESALRLNDKNADAWYNLALLYNACLAGNSDKNLAYSYYKSAAQLGHAKAKAVVLVTDHPDATSDQWFELGLNYDKGEGQPKDEALATVCFEQAVAKNHFDAITKLTTRQHNVLDTADKWHSQALAYNAGANGYQVDYVRSRVCLNNAIALDAKHKDSLVLLAQYYENGLGVERDYILAEKYYDQALVAGYIQAKHAKELVGILKLHPKTSTVDEWRELGILYMFGTDKIIIDYKKARICFEKVYAMQPGDLINLFNMGQLYESGFDVVKDDAKAFFFFNRAVIDDSSKITLHVKAFCVQRESQWSADQWAQMAAAFEGRKDHTKNDYKTALEFYERAIKRDFKHLTSLFRLAELWEAGLAGEKDITKAKKYYLEAAIRGHHIARIKLMSLLEISQPSNTEDGQWVQIGKKYDHSSQGGDFSIANRCFERALSINQNNYDALYTLGVNSQYGCGKPASMSDAKHYYERAGGDNCRKRIISMDNPHINSEQDWNNLADDYYHGLHGRPESDINARVCYEEVLAKNSNHSNALFKMGWFYEHGRSVADDSNKAKEFYERAAAVGSENAKRDLVLLQNKAHCGKDAAKWYTRGDDYYLGRDSFEKCTLKARICYEEVLRHDSKHKSALYWLGRMQENGTNGPSNIDEALTYYKRGAEAGSEECVERIKALRPSACAIL